MAAAIVRRSAVATTRRSSPFPRRRPRQLRRRPERGILVQDRLLELSKRSSWHESKLIAQRGLSLPERLQRVRLSTASVQREHELAAEPLAQRMSRHKVLELGNELRRSPRCQVSVDPIFDRCEPQFLEPRDLVPSEVLVGEVGESSSAPERERLPKCLRRATRIVVDEATSFPGKALELPRVEVDVGERQTVAGRHGLDRCSTERPAKLRDEVLERLGSGRWRRAAPQLLDQTIGGDDLARVQGEKREQGALSPCAELDDATVVPTPRADRGSESACVSDRLPQTPAHSPLPRRYRKWAPNERRGGLLAERRREAEMHELYRMLGSEREAELQATADKIDAGLKASPLPRDGIAMKARTKGSILVASAIVAMIGAGAALSGDGDQQWMKALEARSEALNEQYGLGVHAPVSAGSAEATSEPAWARALRLRSEALNRQYGLGAWQHRTTPAPQGDEPAWLRALRIRSEALNQQYKLGEYGPRS